MAPRKRLLLDDPPSASSSDDSFEEEQQQPAAESESESGSESEPEPTPAPKPKLKSLSSKPMQAKSGTKRSKKQKTTSVSAVSTDDENDDNAEDVKLTGKSSKKSSTRVFSEDDDIIILEKSLVFISETGNNPMKKVKQFLNFVKKYLNIEVNYKQMRRKLRTLKDKYIRDRYNGMDIEDFTAPNEKKVFELSKKIWGNIRANGAEENRKVPMAAKKDATGIAHENLVLNEMFRFGDAVSLSHCMIKGFELVEESKRQSMEDEWRQIKMEEMELFGQRAELLNHRANLIMQALNNSSQ